MSIRSASLVFLPAFSATVAIAAGPAPLVSLDAPITPWRIDETQRATDFVVTTSAESSTVRILRSKLVDNRVERRRPLDAAALEICTPAYACRESVELGKGAPNRLFLKVKDTFKDEGVFTGALDLQFSAGEASEVKSLALTIEQTSARAQRLGLALIILGVIAAWLLLVLARACVARNQALLPAAVLAQRVREIEGRVFQVPPPSTPAMFKAVADRLEMIRSSLDVTSLDANKYLPARIPIQGFEARAAAYQAFLDATSKGIDRLDVVVMDGVLPLATTLARGAGKPVESADTQALLREIGIVASDTALDPAAIRQRLRAALDTWDPPRADLGASARPAAARTPSPYKVLLEISSVSLAMWIGWGVITTLVGYMVLIEMTPGFGGIVDYAKCFLWGFGLPVAGQSLQQLSGSAVNTQLGITFPMR